MRTGNFSRLAAELGHVPEGGWLISIIDVDREPLRKRAEDFIFTFKFADTIWPEDVGAMTNEQAVGIANIIKDAREQKQDLFVHCTAGISRSGAVVELLKILGWKEIEGRPRRIPNTHVFSLLRKQFPELRQSWDDVIDNIAIDEINRRFF